MRTEVMSVSGSTRRQLAREAYLWACELELRAFKPGNVSRYSEGHDMTVDDFRRSAVVSAPFLVMPEMGLGESIFRAIEATRTAVGCNTNLGIVLLAAPLLRTFIGSPQGVPLQSALHDVLRMTTVHDADWVYRAIRLAQPAGLGKAPEADVWETPRISLLEAMRLAVARDSIARQYSNSFSDVFDTAIPLYDGGLSQWDNEEWATVTLFAGLLARYPDSHIERKFGIECARQVSARMAKIEAWLSACRSPQKSLGHLRDVDREFKSRGINPGTTADLTVATLLAAKLASL